MTRLQFLKTTSLALGGVLIPKNTSQPRHEEICWIANPTESLTVEYAVAKAKFLIEAIRLYQPVIGEGILGDQWITRILRFATIDLYVPVTERSILRIGLVGCIKGKGEDFSPFYWQRQLRYQLKDKWYDKKQGSLLIVPAFELA